MDRSFCDRHPLMAWAILLVALAGAFVVYIELLKRSWHFGDAYALLSVYFGAALHTLYRRGCQRDQRTRLKPSPFFFWFSR